jgi:hypothetical protein
MDWEDIEEDIEEEWVWEEDMPVPMQQAWWFDLTAEG